MAEHVPPRVLVALMAVFFAAMAVCRAGLLGGGGRRARRHFGGDRPCRLGVTTIFGTLHILAAITGVLLWQWERHRLPPLIRVALEAATLYFCLAVLVSIFFNYLPPRRCWTESSSDSAALPYSGRRRGGGIQVRGQPSSAPPFQMTTSFRCLSCPISADRPGDR
jgi:hypothetical protein